MEEKIEVAENNEMEQEKKKSNPVWAAILVAVLAGGLAYTLGAAEAGVKLLLKGFKKKPEEIVVESDEVTEEEL